MARMAPQSDAPIAVPHLVGLEVPHVREICHSIGLVPVSRDLDGRPLGELTWPGVFVVTAQDPKPAAFLQPGDVIVIESP
ncbi:MAG: hypothetical protein ACYCZY_11030 [Lacisediminihabitans sp.]